MTWFAAGAATIAVGTSLYASSTASKNASSQASEADAAQGRSVVKERLNKTIGNSYAAAFDQMKLALQKRQLAQQESDVSSGSLVAHGKVDATVASTSSIGATVNQVSADINQKVAQAKGQIQDNWENAQENYNNELAMMKINTDQSEPTLQQYQYSGASEGQAITGAILAGVASFASSYAGAKMRLGAGSTGAGSFTGGGSGLTSMAALDDPSNYLHSSAPEWANYNGG